MFVKTGWYSSSWLWVEPDLDEGCRKHAAEFPICDFRTKPAGDKSTPTKKMTKDEVIGKLKRCIQQQDPAFRKTFLDFGKEPDGKINASDFRKVGERVSPCF